MCASRISCAALVLCGGLSTAMTASAQSATSPQAAAAAAALRQEIEQIRSDFNARMAELEAQLAEIVGEQATAQPAAPAQPTAQVRAGAGEIAGPSGTLPTYGVVSAASNIFNPNIAVVGNFIGVGGRNRASPEPVLEMREAEASFQAIVDPYARADFFMAFGEEGVDLEEGYITFPMLPAGLLMKVGKLRAAFGRVNTFHTHQLPWPDRPLMTVNLLGGEEGIGDSGISVARLIPNPWIFLEATGQLFRGDSGEVFQSSTRGDLSYLGHLRAYHDLTESANVDLGASYARGHNASGVVGDVDVGRFTTDLIGLDATVRWRPLRRSIYQSFVGRSELVWSRREQPDDRSDGVGFYVSADYQFARRWFAGARFDRSDRADDVGLRDTGGSALLTYWPSEFSQVRGQYRRTSYGDGPTANEFLFQFQFSIGAHGAHPF